MVSIKPELPSEKTSVLWFFGDISLKMPGHPLLC